MATRPVTTWDVLDGHVTLDLQYWIGFGLMWRRHASPAGVQATNKVTSQEAPPRNGVRTMITRSSPWPKPMGQARGHTRLSCGVTAAGTEAVSRWCAVLGPGSGRELMS